MVVKLMKWRPWPPVATRKFHVKLKLHSIEGLSHLTNGDSGTPKVSGTNNSNSGELTKLVVNVKWKGPRGPLGSRFQRSLKSGNSTEKVVDDGFTLSWEEEFENFCILTMAKDNSFQPWDLYFTINQVGAKSKLISIGTANMNLARFISVIDDKMHTTKIPVVASNGIESQASLIVSINLFELRTSENTVFDLPILSCIGSPLPKILTSSSPIDTDAEEFSSRSEHISDSSRNSFDTDASDEWDEEEEAHESSEKYCVHSYGPLPGVNLVVEGALSHCEENKHAEDHMPSTCRSGFVDSITKENEQMVLSYEQGIKQSSVRSILSWRKRKLNFMSPKRREEPLLKKTYGENGGDDIDFDRRVSDSSPTMSPISSSLSMNVHGYLDFGDENFAVGSWERKDLVSRDGKMKCSADVFFATIDQRSERAAGESACTALVAVVADWLHQNPGRMPIKTELDTLIREGSSEWRKLCENESYRERFPDKHFDLDTVISAKVRPIVEVPDKSFVGFFQPRDIGDSKDIGDFLQGVMSFGNIWEEITSAQLNKDFEPVIYIVSWNDHFFILQVEKEACYIIDTLGERLYEGCKQAYILRFDSGTELSFVSESSVEDKAISKSPSEGNLLKDKAISKSHSESNLLKGKETYHHQSIDHGTVHRGKDACKEFIQGFFAGLSLREVECDIKKGRVPSLQRLQVEFHFTSSVTKHTSQY